MYCTMWGSGHESSSGVRGWIRRQYLWLINVLPAMSICCEVLSTFVHTQFCLLSRTWGVMCHPCILFCRSPVLTFAFLTTSERRCLFQQWTFYSSRDHQCWHSLVSWWNAYRFLSFVWISRLGNCLYWQSNFGHLRTWHSSPPWINENSDLPCDTLALTVQVTQFSWCQSHSMDNALSMHIWVGVEWKWKDAAHEVTEGQDGKALL